MDKIIAYISTIVDIYMVVYIDAEIRSEFATIFWENRDKARLKKEELQMKLVELKNKCSRLEKEIKELERKAVSV